MGINEKSIKYKVCVPRLIATLFPAFFCLASSPRENVVQYTIEKPDTIQAGKEFQICVRFTISPEWYIYAPTGNNEAQGMIETRVIYTLPAGITRVGKMNLPPPVFKDGHEIYEGKDIAMVQKLQVAADTKKGQYLIKGKVIWQTCNSIICLPPVTEENNIVIDIK